MEFFAKQPHSHGGTLAVGKRKKLRPMDMRKSLHIILRSERAKKGLALVNHRRKIERVLVKMKTKFRIVIYDQNINFDHIHLLVRGRRRKDLQDFFRSIAALIAREVTGAKKGKPFGKFWSLLLFTRIVDWRRDFENVRRYITQNNLETWGLIPYKQRKYRNTS